MITEKKQKEWRDWGKEYYKSTINMIRNNYSHPDYNTPKKIEISLNKAIDEHYNFTENGITRLKTRWNYTDEDIAEAKKLLTEGYSASRDWYKKADVKMQAIIDKYTPLFKKAEEVAKNVDVSDIKDGFPCGGAHLYLDNYPEAEDLRKALGHFSTSKTDEYKYKIPVKMPAYGQCVAYDDRICGKVKEFLRSCGIFTNTYSYID